ncbi:MAG: ABC transporter permease subunit [Aeropyrum sp.]|nr:ABC transporter permease subunit [Aeropyrum sp.]
MALARGALVAISIPPLLFILSFFYAPLAYLAVFSAGEGGLVRPYIEVLTKPQYYTIIVASFLSALAVSIASLLISLPVGYYIVHSASRGEATLLLVLFVAPFIVDILLRALSLKLLLSLLSIKPGWTATTLGLLYGNLPLAIIFSYAGMRGVPHSLIEAARTMGASQLSAHLWITIPLASPWLAAGGVIVFLLSLTDYVVPSLLGGTTGFTVGSLIYYLILSGDRWDLGSALTLLVTLASSLSAFLVFRRVYRVLG